MLRMKPEVRDAMARAWLNWPPAMRVCAVPAWAQRVVEGLASGRLKPDSQQDHAALEVLRKVKETTHE